MLLLINFVIYTLPFVISIIGIIDGLVKERSSADFGFYFLMLVGSVIPLLNIFLAWFWLDELKVKK